MTDRDGPWAARAERGRGVHPAFEFGLLPLATTTPVVPPRPSPSASGLSRGPFRPYIPLHHCRSLSTHSHTLDGMDAPIIAADWNTEDTFMAEKQRVRLST